MRSFLTEPSVKTSNGNGKGKTGGNENKRGAPEHTVAAIAENNKQLKTESNQSSGKGGKGSGRSGYGGHSRTSNGWHFPWGACFCCYGAHPWLDCSNLCKAIARDEKTPWFEQENVEWLENLHNKQIRLGEFRPSMNPTMMAKADAIVRQGISMRATRSPAPPDHKWQEAASRYAAAKKKKESKAAKNRSGYGNRLAQLASSSVTSVTGV